MGTRPSMFPLGAAVGNVSYIEYYPPAYDEVWQNAFNDSLEIDREGGCRPRNVRESALSRTTVCWTDSESYKQDRRKKAGQEKRICMR